MRYNKKQVVHQAIMIVAWVISCVSIAHSMENKPPIGLPNCGASCYMNSAIQALYSSPLLTNIFLNVDVSFALYQPGSLADCYFKLVHQLFYNKTNDIKNILGDMSTLIATKFSQGVRAQEDAVQFMQEIIDQLAHSTNEPTNELLKGIININSKRFERSQQKEIATGQATDEKHLAIPTQDPQGKILNSLSDAMQEYFRWEKNGGKEFRLMLLNAPRLLLIQLNRFTIQKKPDGSVVPIKLNHAVTIPLSLDLQPYIHASAVKNIKEGAAYELVAVIGHRGDSPRAGHYVAYVKRNQGWHLCNDSAITLVPSLPQTTESYVLLYQKKGIYIPPVAPQPFGMLSIEGALSNLAGSINRLTQVIKQKR